MSKNKTLTLYGMTVLAAYLAACSSDVTSGVDDATDAAAESGGATGSGGSGAGGSGGKGGASAGGTNPGTGGKASGGSAGSAGTTGDGGAGNGGTTGDGGSGNGGVGTGGAGTGGAGTGGAGTGGTGAGGAGSGGVGTGGVGTGGAGTGGAGTGGSNDSGAPCGNGVLDPGEECDPPNTAFCDADCQLGGDCTQCEEDNCGGAAIHTDCTTGTAGDLCALAIQCARDHRCYQFDPGTCYCGTHDIVACQNPVGSPPNPANGPIGPCVDEFSAAANSNSASQVLLDLTDPTTALGRAGFMMQCDQAFCPSCFP